MPTNKKNVTGQILPSTSNAVLPHYSTHPSQRARISFIATPIGNLGDISERVVKTLAECDEIWCEDTRHTQNLLHALESRFPAIQFPRLKRVDQHISEKDLSRLLENVSQSGQHIGVVTDAGTPGLSDPGAKILKRMMTNTQSRLRSEIKIEPIAGPSALTAFISIAGFEENSFSFQGFFPRHGPEAATVLESISESTLTRSWIFFESPNRIRETIERLRVWSEGLEFTPKFVFAKEMTKIHETIWIGFGPDFMHFLLQQHFDERGEWVVGIELPKNCVKNEKDESFWMLSLECMIEAGVSTKVAAQIIAEKYSIAKNLAYSAALSLQKNKKNASDA